MTRLQGFATLALLACANLSCSAEPQEKTAVEPPHAQSTVAVAIGKQQAIFRKITPEAYKIDYPDFYLLETEVTNRMYREYLRAIGQSKDDTEVLATVRERESKRSETVTSADGITHFVYTSLSTGGTPYSVNDKGMIWRDGDPTNAEYFNLGARWMGGGFEDGIPISLKEGDVEQMEPRKDYWGYSHDSGLREDHVGFRVLLDLKKDLRLIDCPRFFPQEDTQWQTDGE
jgi:hypothetical protein